MHYQSSIPVISSLSKGMAIAERVERFVRDQVISLSGTTAWVRTDHPTISFVN